MRNNLLLLMVAGLLGSGAVAQCDTIATLCEKHITADGRRYPACDVCAIEHPNGPPRDRGTITDEDLRRIVDHP